MRFPKTILTESLRVLRDKFRRTSEQLEADDAYLRGISRMVTPTERLEVVKADPTDDKIIECAVAASSEVIVSGDQHLLSLGVFRGIAIMKLSDFLAQAGLAASR